MVVLSQALAVFLSEIPRWLRCGWTSYFVLGCRGRRSGGDEAQQPGKTTGQSQTGSRHRLKGSKEQGFSEVLTGLDLYHPPCSALCRSVGAQSAKQVGLPWKWLIRPEADQHNARDADWG